MSLYQLNFIYRAMEAAMRRSRMGPKKEKRSAALLMPSSALEDAR